MMFYIMPYVFLRLHRNTIIIQLQYQDLTVMFPVSIQMRLVFDMPVVMVSEELQLLCNCMQALLISVLLEFQS